MATKSGDASDREASANGLDKHFLKNLQHQKSVVEDDHQLSSSFDLIAENHGVYHGPHIPQASADLLNKLLYENQTKYHVYFSETGGFHNHRVHHLFAAYSLGASPEELQSAYDFVEGMQRPRYPIDDRCILEMHTAEGFASMLGDDRHFHDYLAFFLQKFEKQGWKEVLDEYLFSNTDVSDDLFARMFAGIWHNLILLGYGIEFDQPGIVAEALAGACVHSNVFAPYLSASETRSAQIPKDQPCVPLAKLVQEISGNPTLCDKKHWHGGNSFAYDDDVVSNAPPGMVELAARWKVETPDELPYRTIELINVNAFIAGAAQRSGKAIKIDFIFIHLANASIFFSAFLQKDWIPTAAKIRLLEGYARMNLLFYAACLGPELQAHEVINYKPREANSTWPSIIKRGLALSDDGHLLKFIRVLAHGEKASQPWELEDEAQRENPLLPVKGSMWLQIANMAIDSAEAEQALIKRWVRGAGSDEAWAVVPDRMT